jgi:hypothetical protein
MPVRLLNDFVIYNLVTLEVVPVAELTQIQYSTTAAYGASGIAEAWVDEDDDQGDDIDPEEVGEEPLMRQRVKLSKIVEFNVHHFSQRKQNLDRYISLKNITAVTISLLSSSARYTFVLNMLGTFSIRRQAHSAHSSPHFGSDIGFFILSYHSH